MARKWSPALVASLLEATNHCHFIQVLCRAAPRPLSYSALTRRAGFSSRSYVRDVAEGTRRLTPLAVPKFAKGLGLSGEWKEYFMLLVSLEETDSRPEGWSEDRVRKRMDRLRTRLQEKRERTTAPATQADLLKDIPHFVRIYAASGISQQGAHFEQIQQRTTLAEPILKTTLEKMEQANLLTWDRTRNYICPKDFHLSITQAGRQTLFHQLFIESLKNAEREFLRNSDSTEKLFHQSVFCVRKSDLTSLKENLRNLLLNYVDTHIESQGDTIVTLVTALY